MLKSTIFLFFFMLTLIMGRGQAYIPALAVDTIRLPEIRLKKVVAYKIGDVTILASYKDFMKFFIPFWKQHQNRVRSLTENEAGVSSEFTNRFIFLDTTLKRVKNDLQKQDTILIYQSSFEQVGLGTSYPFPEKMEDGKCIVINKFLQIQRVILRQKQTISRGFNASWGGRFYFLPGEVKAFIVATDWSF